MNRAGGGTYTGTRPSVQSLMIGRLLLPRPSQVLDDVIDARGERGHVRRLHRGEHADAQLVAPELAVSGRVYDAVLAQRGDDLFGADRVIQVDGDDRIGARARVGDERPGVFAALRPLVQQRGGLRATCRGPGHAAILVEPAHLILQHD